MREKLAVICSLVLVLSALAGAAPGEEDSARRSSHGTHGGQLSVFGGVMESNIGGGSSWGPAIGIATRSTAFVRQWHATLALQYSRKGGTGRVVNTHEPTGELMFDGPAEVDLNYIQLGATIERTFGGEQFMVAPFAGLAPALLVGQSATPTDESSSGALANYGPYSGGDVLVLAGVRLLATRWRLDFEYAQGTTDLGSDFGGTVGHASGGSVLGNRTKHSRSLRIAIGRSL